MDKETQAFELDARQIQRAMNVGKATSKSEMIDSAISNLGAAVSDLHEFIDLLNGPLPGKGLPNPSGTDPVRPFMDVICSAPERIHIEVNRIREAVIRLGDMLS